MMLVAKAKNETLCIRQHRMDGELSLQNGLSYLGPNVPTKQHRYSHAFTYTEHYKSLTS